MSSDQNLRFERKFFVEDLSEKEMLYLIKTNSFRFAKLFQPRWINNFYFDDAQMSAYHENVNGDASRSKVRLRWYGELWGNIQKPTLEIKIKEGLMGTKELFPIPDFELQKGFSVNQIRELLLQAALPETLKERIRLLTPVLANRYQRRYFIEATKKFRLTLDSYQSFYRLKAHDNKLLQSCTLNKGYVAELKYAKQDNHHANQITSQFPFRMTKNSKYVTGVEKLFH